MPLAFRTTLSPQIFDIPSRYVKTSCHHRLTVTLCALYQFEPPGNKFRSVHLTKPRHDKATKMSSLRKSKTPKVDTLLVALNPYLPPASQQFPHVLRDRCSYPSFTQAEAPEPKTHQLISSIAALCVYYTPPTPESLEVVHSAKNPVVSVALEVKPYESKQVNIYFATNHAPPPQLTRHVAACLRHIKKLHQIAREKGAVLLNPLLPR